MSEGENIIHVEWQNVLSLRGKRTGGEEDGDELRLATAPRKKTSYSPSKWSRGGGASCEKRQDQQKKREERERARREGKKLLTPL